MWGAKTRRVTLDKWFPQKKWGIHRDPKRVRGFALMPKAADDGHVAVVSAPSWQKKRKDRARLPAS